MIKGVGPVMATRIVNKFGMDTMDVIEQAPEKLREVSGLGKSVSIRLSRRGKRSAKSRT